MRPYATCALLLSLSACATTPTPKARIAAPAPLATPGAIRDGVIGQSAGGLQALFGTPSAQLSEGPARKLQFAGTACVLDAYLYAPSRGGEPAVVHVDTRRPSGEDMDRATCVAALRGTATRL